MKIFTLIISLLCFLIFSGCGSTKDTTATTESTEDVEKAVDRLSQSQRTSPGNWTGFSSEEYNAMISELNLSEEQESSLNEINQKYSQQVQEIMANSGADYNAGKEELRMVKEAQNADIQALLSMEQFETYTSYMKEWRERRRGQRGQRSSN